MKNTAQLDLRIGVAFAFLYPPIDALVDPFGWIGYFPGFMHGFVPDMILLHGFGLFEVAIALWLLSGYRIRTPAILAMLTLLSIVILDRTEFQVTFRDLSIAAAALALALLPDSRSEKDSTTVHDIMRT